MVARMATGIGLRKSAQQGLPYENYFWFSFAVAIHPFIRLLHTPTAMQQFCQKPVSQEHCASKRRQCEWKLNRKLYALYRMVTLLMTLGDP